MRLEPVLDILSVVRVPVGCNHRVIHQRALERHVAQLIWNTPHEDLTRWRSMQIEKDGPEALTRRFRDDGCGAGRGAAKHLILNSGRELAIREWVRFGGGQKSVNLIKLVCVVCGFQVVGDGHILILRGASARVSGVSCSAAQLHLSSSLSTQTTASQSQHQHSQPASSMQSGLRTPELLESGGQKTPPSLACALWPLLDSHVLYSHAPTQAQ